MSSSLDAARFAVLVHEVRSPVAALAAVAEAVADAPARDASMRGELIRLAVAACRSIERVVLDVAMASVRAEPVDVGALTREVIAARVVRGADVVAAIEEDLLVEGDPVRLGQVLDNLIANALIHGGPGRVTVRARRTEGAISVSVSDEGAGIPADEVERIFEPGVRLGAAAPGSGLGLPLARAIVVAHGGSLDVDPTSDAGASFTLVLPRSGHPDTAASNS